MCERLALEVHSPVIYGPGEFRAADLCPPKSSQNEYEPVGPSAGRRRAVPGKQQVMKESRSVPEWEADTDTGQSLRQGRGTGKSGTLRYGKSSCHQDLEATSLFHLVSLSDWFKPAVCSGPECKQHPQNTEDQASCQGEER